MGRHQRFRILGTLLVGLIIGLGIWPGGAMVRPDPPKIAATDSAATTAADGKEVEGIKKASPAKEIRRLMSQPTDKLKTGVAKGTPLKDALEHICRKHEVRPGQPLSFVINHKAFADAGDPDIEKKQVELPPSPPMRLSEVLVALLRSLDPPELQGTYLIKGDCIEITTLLQVQNEYARAIRIEFDKQPLGEALEELTDLTGLSIVLDGSLGDKAKFRVTGVFHDVQLFVVVRLLADMAGLQIADLEHVLYVTTKKKAKAVREDYEGWQQERGGAGMRAFR